MNLKVTGTVQSFQPVVFPAYRSDFVMAITGETPFPSRTRRWESLLVYSHWWTYTLTVLPPSHPGGCRLKRRWIPRCFGQIWRVLCRIMKLT